MIPQHILEAHDFAQEFLGICTCSDNTCKYCRGKAKLQQLLATNGYQKKAPSAKDYAGTQPKENAKPKASKKKKAKKKVAKKAKTNDKQ